VRPRANSLIRASSFVQDRSARYPLHCLPRLTSPLASLVLLHCTAVVFLEELEPCIADHFDGELSHDFKTVDLFVILRMSVPARDCPPGSTLVVLEHLSGSHVIDYCHPLVSEYMPLFLSRTSFEESPLPVEVSDTLLILERLASNAKLR